MAPLVLASASPRRRVLLSQVGVPFEVRPSDVDEVQGPDESPVDFAARAARDKALDVAERLGREGSDAFVLGADTIVLHEGRALGKPRDDADALAMVGGLVGRAHEVITAVCLARTDRGVVGEVQVRTGVRFREAAPAEVQRYVATGEGRDKAGAYAVQGIGAGFVQAIEGSYPNVVGLPLVETLELLRAGGALGEWP
jgi:septum formation protein